MVPSNLIDSLNPDLRSVETFNGKTRTKEFFAMSPEDAYSILEAIAKISGTVDRLHRVTPTGDEVKAEEEAAEVKAEARRGPFRFSMVDIPVGAEVVFVGDESVKATVVDDRHIRYNDEVTSLSRLAQVLKGFDHAVQGTLWFTYQGKVLNDLRNEMGMRGDSDMQGKPTEDQLAFVGKYIPFLRDALDDPEKQQWCRDYMSDNAALMVHDSGHTPAAVDKWGLEKAIYEDLIRDAHEMGMVPQDYLETVDGIRDEDGGRRPLEELTDHEVVCLVAHAIRAERFVENALLFAVMDGTLLRHLQELERRWSADLETSEARTTRFSSWT